MFRLPWAIKVLAIIGMLGKFFSVDTAIIVDFHCVTYTYAKFHRFVARKRSWFSILATLLLVLTLTSL